MSLLFTIPSAEELAPTDVTLPLVTGTPAVGALLTAASGTWRGVPRPTFAYQWQRLSSVTAPANTVLPALSGTATDGATISTSNGTWTGSPSPTFSYQWQRSATGTGGWANITGAVASSYVIGDVDVQNYLRCVVAGTNTGGAAAANSAASTQVTQLPSIVTTPVLSGTAQVGQVLSATNGTWAGFPAPTFTYQWGRSTDGITFSNISGATSSTYTVQSADLNDYLRCNVTATNSVGNTSSVTLNSAQVIAANVIPVNTVVPAVTGLAQEGAVLTSDNGTWAGFPAPTFAVKWQRSVDGSTGWTDISGATGSTYTLVSADDNEYVRSFVTATNGSGSTTANSTATGPIAAPGSSPANTVVPAVTGTLQRGSVLSCSQGTWTGSPTPSFAYQWKVSTDGGATWTNATGSGNATNAYTLARADVGGLVKCVVTASNSHGSVSTDSNVTTTIGSLYSPDIISGLHLWLKARDLSLADGAGVATWPDGSGNSHDATQATTGNQPTLKLNQLNGHPAVLFTRANAQYMASSALSTYLTGPGVTMIVVFKPTSVLITQNLIGCATSNGLEYLVANSNKLQLSKANVSAIGLSSGTISAGVWHALVVDYGNSGTSNAHHFIDGTANGSPSSAVVASGSAGTQIGAQQASSHADGMIAEIITYDKVLSSTERSHISGYLEDWYGITMSDYV